MSNTTRSRRTLTLVAIWLVAGIAAIGASGQVEPDGAEQPRRIGISVFVSHPALDAVATGISDELTELGFTDLVYDIQYANADISTAASIASKFRADRVDLAIGIATPTAQALANAITEVPVIYAAVTDPVVAGLVPSLDAGFRNVTGSSDLTPVAAQFDVLEELIDVGAIGHVYSSGETNAVALAALARAEAESRGLTFVEATVTNSSEVRSATLAIADRVDALYVSTDNTVVSALSAMIDVAASAGIPIISADTTSAEEGGVLAALGFDYYKFGRATGRLVADVLSGTDPATIPALILTDPSDLNLLIDLDTAEALGIAVPAALRSAATMIYEDGTLR